MGLCLIAAMDTAWAMDLAWRISSVALGLGFVIFVHELGHFLVAKLCGVKCEKFYVGFDIPIRIGPIELSRFGRFQWGETEYGIGILPLGGYVKMLGQDDDPRNAQLEAERIRVRQDESAAADSDPNSAAAAAPPSADTERGQAWQDGTSAEGLQPGQTVEAEGQDFELDPRSFPAKPVIQRMFIISAGVIMNLIFAVIFAMFAFRGGVPYIPCEIGGTIPGSPAWLAGLPAGSKIIQITRNGQPSEKLRFIWDLSNSGVGLAQDKEDLPLLVRTKEGDTEWFDVRPVLSPISKGKLPMIGVRRASQLKIGKIFDSTSAANATPKLEQGDRIVAADGVALSDALQLEEVFSRDVNKPLTLTVERSSKPSKANTVQTQTLDAVVAPNPIQRLGLVMHHGPITGVRPNSPAARAGFRVGDVLETIAGQVLGDPMSLPTRLQQYYGQEIVVQVRRSGQSMDLTVTPQQPQTFDWSLSPGFPMAAEALGIAYSIGRTVKDVVPDSPAGNAGLKVGDSVVGVRFSSEDKTKSKRKLINRGKIVELSDNGFDWIFVFSQIQLFEADDVLSLSFTRAGTSTDEPSQTANLKPVASAAFNPDRGLLLESQTKTYVADTWSEALALGFRQTGQDASKVLRFLKKLVTGEISATNLGGPLSIAVVAGSEASKGLPRLLIFLTFLSANLAVLNFLPIPALDGGHMIFLLAEGVRGKPVDERMQMALTLAGVACLLCLMVFVFGLDIQRMFF